MASILHLLSLTILLLSFPTAATAVPEHELQSMLEAIRARGYNLFANAITTSEIYYDILSGTSFTLFSPTDSSLFALDMTATASDYTSTLKYHVVSRRLSLADLRRLSPVSSIRTIALNHEIHIERRGSPGSEFIAVDGVRIVTPGLFYGRDIAVHGLGGILSLRSQIGSRQESLPMTTPAENFTGNNHSFREPVVGDSHAPPLANIIRNRTFRSPPGNSSEYDGFEPLTPSGDGIDNHTVESPLAEPASIKGSSPANSPGTGGLPLKISPAYDGSELPRPSTDGMDNHTVLSPVAEPARANGFSPVNSPATNGLPLEIAPALTPRAEPPALPFSEGEYLAFSSPLIGGDEPKEERRLAGDIPETMTTVTMPEKSRPLDDKPIDCPLTDDEMSVDHVSVHHGYLYTDLCPNIGEIIC